MTIAYLKFNLSRWHFTSLRARYRDLVRVLMLHVAKIFLREALQKQGRSNQKRWSQDD